MISDDIGLYRMIMGLNVVYPENTMVWKSIHELSTCRHPFNASKDVRYFRLFGGWFHEIPILV
jgi:hypothetical protein